ncbi:hypothetical protein F4818DRAFT_445907 [Hypoxylon cercidicola]|nr:hypothetical protein F4818DRAFT_445907 [Hypoxylon cercidicola]
MVDPPQNSAAGSSVSEIRIKRSDGKDYPAGRCHGREEAPDVQVQNWLKKLAVMIRDQLYPMSDKPFVLRSFPSNYRLRMQSRGAGSSHVDYYLYGYPTDSERDPLKYFRSAQEFWPHLLWLLGDENVQCHCKHCTPKTTKAASSVSSPSPGLVPDPGSPRVPAKKSATTAIRPTTQAAAKPGSRPVTQPGSRPATQTATRPATHAQITNATFATPTPSAAGALVHPATRTSARPTSQTPAQATVHPATRAPAQPFSQTPTQSAQPFSQTPIQSAQASASNYAMASVPLQPDEAVLFREGEVIWFTIDERLFRLALVLENLPKEDPSEPFMNRLQPLSSPMFPVDVIVRSEAELRPFLTFSVPSMLPCIVAVADQLVADIDWVAVQRVMPWPTAKANASYLSIEVSKLAANQMDHSYSLFNLINTGEHLPDQLCFGGVFLGAEKIGVMEAVRVSLSKQEHELGENKKEVFAMVVKKIILRQTAAGESLSFFGDVWHVEATPVACPDQLPAAMERERAYRTKIMGTPWNWVPVLRDAEKPEKAIRGRFYESEKLGPKLFSRWNDWLQEPQVGAIQEKLNSRFDCTSTQYIGRMQSRLTTLAGAIPPNTDLSLGPHILEWPPLRPQ